MTPSAVSQQLSNLTKQLGVPLLEAQGRRVRLTDAAHLVLRHAEAVFAQLESADAELTGYLRGEAGEVRVGAFSTAVPALVVPAVRLLRADDRPGPSVRVREAEAAEAYELLSARRRRSRALPRRARTDRPRPALHSPPSARRPARCRPPRRTPAGRRPRVAAGRPRCRAVDLRRFGPVVGDHHGRVRGRRVRAGAGAQRLRVDRDPRHGRSGHGCRTDPADGVGGTPYGCGDACSGGGPAPAPCGRCRTAGCGGRAGGGPGPVRASAGQCGPRGTI